MIDRVVNHAYNNFCLNGNTSNNILSIYANQISNSNNIIENV